MIWDDAQNRVWRWSAGFRARNPFVRNSAELLRIFWDR